MIMAEKKTVKKVAAKKETRVVGLDSPSQIPAPYIDHATPSTVQARIQILIDELGLRDKTRELDIVLANLRKSIVWLNR